MLPISQQLLICYNKNITFLPAIVNLSVKSNTDVIKTAFQMELEHQFFDQHQ